MASPLLDDIKSADIPGELVAFGDKYGKLSTAFTALNTVLLIIILLFK